MWLLRQLYRTKKTRDRLKKYSDTNCERDTATARKWGNQPKQNRGKPPLSRERGYRELALLQDEGFITACEDGIHYKNK